MLMYVFQNYHIYQTFNFAGHLEIPSPDHVSFRVVPSGLGMRGPLAGFCVQCGHAAVCREGRAAADKTYNRTVVSPGHAPDRSEPEDRSQIKSELIYLKHILPQGRKSSSV